MKKVLALIVISVLLMGSVAYAADVVVSFTVPDAKVTKARTGYLSLYPKADDFVGTDLEWVEFVVKQVFVRDVHRGLVKKAKNEAGAGIILDPDIIQ